MPAPKSQSRYSIAVRLALLLLFASVICVAIAGAYIAHTESTRLREQAREQLTQDAASLSKSLNEKIHHIRKLALAGNQLVATEVFSTPTQHSRMAEVGLDGARRSDDGISAAFVAKSHVDHPNVAALFNRSRELWNVLGPSLRSTFFNYYFISEEQFIRIFPPQWALEIEASHDFHQDIFYSVATPQKNPLREPIWTPLYYDDVWQKWMTSLIIPVYQGDTFRGITGNDVILDDIFKEINEYAKRHSDAVALLLDKNGEVLTDSHQISDLMNKNVPMNTLLDVSESPFLPNNAIAQIINSDDASVYETTIDNESYFGASAVIESLGWHIVIVGSERAASDAAKKLQSQLLIITALVGIAIAFLTFFILSRMLLTPLRQLAFAAADIAGGNFETPLPAASKSEIGLLNQSFRHMMSEVGRLVRGLESEIEEKEKAEASNRKLLEALEQASYGVLIVDRQLTIEYVNQRFLEMTGLKLSDVRHNVLPRVLHITPLMLETMANAQLQRAHKSEQQWPHSSGAQHWVLQSISPLHDARNVITHYVINGEDIEALKESQAEVERLAFQDPLTGLDNRHIFKRHLHTTIERVKRSKNFAALLYVDLDFFKEINDTMGHDTGDLLLIEVGTRIKNSIRKDDHCARLGGDEFAIILNHVRDADACAIVANAILGSFEKAALINDRLVPIAASIGITLLPEDGNDPIQLMKNADLALYKAKAAGRRCFRFFTKELQQVVEHRREMDSRIRTALRRDEFRLFWQPQINMRTMKILGFEALIRWQSQDTIITPDKFLPIAEENGLINDIGRWVLRQAIVEQSSLSEIFDEDIRISVNLSPRQFSDDQLLVDLHRCIDDALFPAGSLELEITENSLIQNIEAANTILTSLQSLGVRVAIDDFGIGHCSLSYLRQLPVNTLKIDRSFVRNLADDESSNAIVDAVLAMSKKLKLDVVAEGVEYNEHFTILRDAGCQIGQGYLFGRPMPLTALPAWKKEFIEKFESEKTK